MSAQEEELIATAIEAGEFELARCLTLLKIARALEAIERRLWVVR